MARYAAILGLKLEPSFQETWPDTPRATLGAARLHKLELRDLVCLVVVVPVCIGAVAQGDEGRNENGKSKKGNFGREIHDESPYSVKGWS